MLGLSDPEFYDLTPRQYYLLLDEHKKRQKHTEWLTGVIASAIGNFSMGRPEELLQPKDFPLALLQDGKQRAPRINRKAVAAKIRAVFEVLKARQNR